jgi:hypothetical protein
MSSATSHATSTREDARAFADAFAPADDAFTFGSVLGESRTVTLSELETVLELGAPVAVPRVRPAAPAPNPAVEETKLISLAELGDVLARPTATSAELDFDFGAGTAERARRRTAARRQPASSVAAGAERASRRRAAHQETTTKSPSRAVEPAAPVPRAADLRSGIELWHGAQIPARRVFPGSAALRRLRAEPDRIALYAVLLGILLVLIAATSSSAGATALPVLQLW